MQLKPSFALLFALVTLATANPVTIPFMVLEHLDSIPDGFTNDGPADADTPLTLTLAMVSSNLSGLQEKFYAISTPDNPLYGQHLSKEEVESYVRPSADTTNKVNAWLSQNGITPTTISPAGDLITMDLPVSKAQEMFSTQFIKVTDEATQTQAVRTLQYSVPADLGDSIDLVHPMVTFPISATSALTVSSPITQAKNVTANDVSSSCQGGITPPCLQDLYGIPTTVATQSRNTLGVTGFNNEFANQNDLSAFLSNYRPDLSPSTSFAFQPVDNGQNSQNPSQAGTEANLDIQYTVGVASGVPTIFYSVGPRNGDGARQFLDVTNFILGQDDAPDVVTTSYDFNEQQLTPKLANLMCNGYMKLGARGISVLFSSGDGGVAGVRNNQCTTFVPTFPSTCPYVTTVGATTGFSPETAASLSSGGFSNYFQTPDYQAQAVSAYLSALGSTNAGLFNASGRGFPDVSAQGQDVVIVVEENSEFVDGTSCSSPIFASVISLINDRRIAAGKTSLGFLNPFLYSPAGSAALTDVTSGNNPGCGTQGFPATSGWDPVTGLGTPNFENLLAAAMVL